jgi:hypothetical protein
MLLTGTSGSGKSTFALGFLERLREHGYQFCIIDPEGDYQNFEDAVMLGDAKRAPIIDEVYDLLQKSEQNVSVNFLGVSLDHRPAYFEELLPALLKLRLEIGRPHWIAIDETHHLMPQVGAALQRFPRAPGLIPSPSTPIKLPHPSWLRPIWSSPSANRRIVRSVPL